MNRCSPLPDQQEFDWTPNQRKLQKLEATNVGPDRKNQESLAQEVGICRRTLVNWHNLPGWQKEVNRIAKEASAESYPKIIDSLIKAAIRGDHSDRRLYLQWIGEIGTPGSVSQVVNANVGISERKLTPEEVLQRAVSENGNRMASLLRGTRYSGLEDSEEEESEI